MDEVLLLVDTCGERASVALTRDGLRRGEVVLPDRAASVSLLDAVSEVLASGGVRLQELSGVGVVSGPGSFTGVRVGLAVCKGLCEAVGLPIAAVSRLEVLADAAKLCEGVAVLRAGREQVYARDVRNCLGQGERLLEIAAMREMVHGREVVCAEEVLLPALQEVSGRVRLVALTAADASGTVRRCLAEGGSDLAQVDANYVRDEETIYVRGQRGG